MNGKETSKDIIADMRTKAECAKPYDDGIVMMLTDYADRLDEAHEREVDALKQRLAELDAEVAAKDEVIKRLNDAISEEQRRKMATTEKSSAVGDAAKLREALIKAVTMLAVCEWPDGTNMEGVEELRRDIDAALDIPPRNCDRFASAEEAWDAYDEWVESCRAKGQTPAFNEFGWLFALAAEKEGGNK